MTEINHKKLNNANTPYTIYAEVIDKGTEQQFLNVLNEPYVTYGALMPDTHYGYTMPIGGVCSTKDMIVPQFVGFDIGCGMCAYKTTFKKTEIKESAKTIHRVVSDIIPTGFARFKFKQDMPEHIEKMPKTDFAKDVFEKTGYNQLGTLGGGNHFIEIGYGNDDYVWIIIHSGSRGVGAQIAQHYMDKAHFGNPEFERNIEKEITESLKQLVNSNKKFKEYDPEKYEEKYNEMYSKSKSQLLSKIKPNKVDIINPLDVNSQDGKNYITDLDFALNFALENRKRMIEHIYVAIGSILYGDNTIGTVYDDIDFTDENRFINRNHNHAEYDSTREEWIHRKGATHAEKDMMGVIPGNMRDGSFIVRGKGNSKSLNSSSHGAGRVMSRNYAKKNISMDEYKDATKDIVGTITKNTLDEAPFAYKDIFEVMDLQKDLVDIVDHIVPLINVKDNLCKKKRK